MPTSDAVINAENVEIARLLGLLGQPQSPQQQQQTQQFLQSSGIAPATQGPFAGSGGGIFGAMCERLIADASFNGYLQGKVRSSFFPGNTALPWASVMQVAGVLGRESDGLIAHDMTIQLSIFAEGFNAARLLGMMATRILLDRTKGPYTFDNISVWLIPTMANVMRDKELSVNSKEIYHAMRRFKTTISE